MAFIAVWAVVHGMQSGVAGLSQDSGASACNAEKEGLTTITTL